MIEIGPGPGGLTRALVEGGAEVVAVERDPRCVAALAELRGMAPSHLQIVEADALSLSLQELAGGRPFAIVANLPYNIATTLLVRWLHALGGVERMILMFQKEVAQRLAAEVGGAAYGRLAVITQVQCRVERVFDLPSGAFQPPPKVASSLVRLVPLPEQERPDARTLRAIERLTAAAFSQRRKMLRRSLAPLGDAVVSLLEPLGISPTARAEDVPVARYRALAQALVQSGDAADPVAPLPAAPTADTP